MVRVIMGVKGPGKTKQMIELINTAVQNEHGNVVCIERGPKLTYDINYKIRLVEASHYDMKDYEFLKGFVSGLYGGNYDITHVFVDSILKVGGPEKDLEGLGAMFDKLSGVAEIKDVNLVFTVSADENMLPENMKKYL